MKYLLTMPPSYWKDFIYIVCCCLGDEYLDEIDEYNKEQIKQREKEKERFYLKEPTVQNNTIFLRKTQSCYFPRPSPKTTNEKKKKKRKGLNWIIGNDYLNHDD